MPNFVYDVITLNGSKVDLNPLPFAEDPNKWIQAVQDWNPAIGASNDLRGAIVNNLFLGFGPQASQPPVPVGGSARIMWVRSTDQHLLYFNGTTTVDLSAGGVAIGSIVTGATAGSVLFAGAAGALTQDNANFFWDDSLDRLGIGNAAPTANLHVTGTARITSTLTLSALTNGSVLFAGPSGVVSQDNANLNYDDTNNRLGVGTVPLFTMHAVGPSGILSFPSGTAGVGLSVQGFNGITAAYIKNGDITGVGVALVLDSVASSFGGAGLVMLEATVFQGGINNWNAGSLIGYENGLNISTELSRTINFRVAATRIAMVSTAGFTVLSGGLLANSLDRSAAGALTLGGTTATSIAVGHSGITTTVTGGLSQLTGAVSLASTGAASFTSTSTLAITATTASTWNNAGGIVQTRHLDTASAVDLEIGDVNASNVWLGKVGGGFIYINNNDILFRPDAGAKSIKADNAPADTAGNQLAIYGATGGPSVAATGGLGGALTFTAGNGGAGSATFAAGPGAPINIATGNGGTNGGGGSAQGGNWNWSCGSGSPAIATAAGGQGGVATLSAGTGGAGHASQAGGAGGLLRLTSGAGGANAGGGAGNAAALQLFGAAGIHGSGSGAAGSGGTIEISPGAGGNGTASVASVSGASGYMTAGNGGNSGGFSAASAGGEAQCQGGNGGTGSGSGVGGAGGGATFRSGNGGTGTATVAAGSGGLANIQTGTGGTNALGGGGNGGSLEVRPGAGSAAISSSPGGDGGIFYALAGAGGAGTTSALGGTGGAIDFQSGFGGAGGVGGFFRGGHSGAYTLRIGTPGVGGNAGTFSVIGATGGAGGNTNFAGGSGSAVSLAAGVGGAGVATHVAGAGGGVTLTAGNAGTDGGGGGAAGGSITMDAGTSSTGNNGSITLGATNTFAINVGRAAGRIGFFGTTAVVQPSSTGETVGFTAGTGTGVNDDSTFTGNVGATAYRISDVVKHMKNLGLLAA